MRYRDRSLQGRPQIDVDLEGRDLIGIGIWIVVESNFFLFRALFNKRYDSLGNLMDSMNFYCNICCFRFGLTHSINQSINQSSTNLNRHLTNQSVVQTGAFVLLAFFFLVSVVDFLSSLLFFFGYLCKKLWGRRLFHVNTLVNSLGNACCSTSANGKHSECQWLAFLPFSRCNVGDACQTRPSGVTTFLQHIAGFSSNPFLGGNWCGLITDRGELFYHRKFSKNITRDFALFGDMI